MNENSLVAEIRKNRAEILRQYDRSILKYHNDIIRSQPDRGVQVKNQGSTHVPNPCMD